MKRYRTPTSPLPAPRNAFESDPPLSDDRCILFTAFEPSGDEHAAPVIRELRRRRPETAIHAFGGPRMAAAGARLIEQTTGNASMLGVGLAKIREQLRLRKQLNEWLADHPVAVHVPTDSPAANWAMVKAVKRQWPEAKTAHLVAPQVWAWASWRVRRLRKWSDQVLCLLPFEPAWFAARGVKATFIGHPLFDEALDADTLTADGADLPESHPRIALLPGSRMGEVEANGRDLLAIFTQVRRMHPHAEAVVAAVHEQVAERMRDFGADQTPGVRVAVARTPTVLHWSDLAITVSGTVTLHVARHEKPMVILYRVKRLGWHLLGRWMIDTRTFTLPNLIAAGDPAARRGDHAIPEFVPLLGGTEPVAMEVRRLLDDPSHRQRQQRALSRIVARFDGHDAATEAAGHISAMIDTVESGNG